MLPRCLRQKSELSNGVLSAEVGPHKDLRTPGDPIDHRRIQCNSQGPQSEGKNQAVGEECALDLLSGAVEKPEDKPEDVEEKGGLVEENGCGTSEPSKPWITGKVQSGESADCCKATSFYKLSSFTMVLTVLKCQTDCVMIAVSCSDRSWDVSSFWPQRPWSVAIGFPDFTQKSKHKTRVKNKHALWVAEGFINLRRVSLLAFELPGCSVPPSLYPLGYINILFRPSVPPPSGTLWGKSRLIYGQTWSKYLLVTNQ